MPLNHRSRPGKPTTCTAKVVAEQAGREKPEGSGEHLTPWSWQGGEPVGLFTSSQAPRPEKWEGDD